MGQESSLKSGVNQELHIQSTFYQGGTSETSTFHKQTLPPVQDSKGQLFLQGHENMVSRAEATPASAQSHSTQQHD